MSDEAALLHAIRDQPSDDLPRLVLADWYEEHGNPARAEFIRVQCEFAQLGKDDPRRVHLHERQANLLADHRRAWLPPGWSFPAYPAEKWRRGFVSRVEKQGGRLTREDGGSLAAVPTLESLSFLQTGVDDTEFQYLPSIPNLKEFSLWGSEELTDVSFARFDRWPALESLALLGTGLTDSGFAHLADIRGLRVLIVYDGEAEVLSDEGLAFLAGMTSLTELSLAAPRVTGRGLVTLADLPRLRKLAIGGCGLTEDAILPLISCHGLEELNLDYNWTEGQGNRLFAALPQLNSLRVLHAIRNDVTPGGFQVLGQLTALEELAVGGQGFGDRELAHLRGLRRLRRLHLHGNQFSRAGLASLATLPSLHALNLGNSLQDQESLEALGELRQLRWLYLDMNASDTVLGHIADLPLLEVLQVRSPFVTDAGLRQLRRLPKLRCLSVGDCAAANEFTWDRRAEWAPNLESLILNGQSAGPTEGLSQGWREC